MAKGLAECMDLAVFTHQVQGPVHKETIGTFGDIQRLKPDACLGLSCGVIDGAVAHGSLADRPGHLNPFELLEDRVKTRLQLRKGEGEEG